MQRFRTLAGQSPAIMIALAALVVSLGGGANAADVIGNRDAPAAAAGGAFTFHDLTLINGWQPFGHDFGHPGYAVNGNAVRLRGALMQPSDSKPQFALLPEAARLAHVLLMPACTGR